LKKKSTENQILNSVTELNSITLRMNEMLNSVGRQVLGKDNKEYEQVIESQLKILIEFYSLNFSDIILAAKSLDEEEFININLINISKIIYDGLKYKPQKGTNHIAHSEFVTLMRKISNEINKVNQKLIFNPINFRDLKRTFESKIEPFIKGDKEEDLFILKLTEVLKHELAPLPF
jgi:hypothetical protein